MMILVVSGINSRKAWSDQCVCSRIYRAGGVVQISSTFGFFQTERAQYTAAVFGHRRHWRRPAQSRCRIYPGNCWINSSACASLHASNYLFVSRLGVAPAQIIFDGTAETTRSFAAPSATLFRKCFQDHSCAHPRRPLLY